MSVSPEFAQALDELLSMAPDFGGADFAEKKRAVVAEYERVAHRSDNWCGITAHLRLSQEVQRLTADLAAERQTRMRQAATIETLRTDLADVEANYAAERQRWEELRKAICELGGFSEDWPTHGNAPLAIAASYALLQNEVKAERQRADGLRSLLAHIRPGVEAAPWVVEELRAALEQKP